MQRLTHRRRPRNDRTLPRCQSEQSLIDALDGMPGKLVSDGNACRVVLDKIEERQRAKRGVIDQPRESIDPVVYPPNLSVDRHELRIRT